MKHLATYESGKGKTFDLTETLEDALRQLSEAATFSDIAFHPANVNAKKVLRSIKPSKHKYILIELEERNGEQEYRQHVRKKIEKDVKPEDIADYVARTWYEEGENAEASDGGYYHLGGRIFVKVESITEITEQEFNVLQKLSI